MFPGKTEYDVVRTTVRTDRPMSLDGMVRADLSEFHATDGPPPCDAQWKHYLRTLLGTAMKVLLYACTESRDIAALPPPLSRRLEASTQGWHLLAGLRQPPHQLGASVSTY